MPTYSLSCCTDALPCDENEGGCYYDSECIGDLICNQGDGVGEGNCPSQYPDYFDCCALGKSGFRSLSENNSKRIWTIPNNILCFFFNLLTNSVDCIYL